MPGKTPTEAIHNYIGPLQQSISCFGPFHLRASGYAAAQRHALVLSPEVVMEVMTKSGEVLFLSFAQQFEVTKALLGPYKVTTRAYSYSVEDEKAHEILAYHWHPDESQFKFPHMHIGHGAGFQLRPEIRAIHFRTDRIAFEDFALEMIRDFGVEPVRTDAEQVLEANLAKFINHRTWSSK